MSIKLNLGCWNRNIPGFINIDKCDFPHIHHNRDIENLSIFDDNSVDLIYSSHSFEYFDRIKAIEVLREWRRVLKKGGKLRLAVPNFDKLMSVYQKTKDLNNILGPLYGMMEINTLNGIKTIFHKTTYDFESISKILLENGFEKIKKYDWRKTIHKDYDDHSQAYFPHMDKENGILISLNIEALKK